MTDKPRTKLTNNSARLKSLEMQGYKSFANKTLFEFAPTVTAVVGPNGSGKSNIADAIRWVLGEQSYSLLRGKKTEDMIFTGSDSRARAGMASATITFDNESGWLPIDFTEVTISRKAHRDGQNEYYLNDQRVRLRDVSELLSASGLAQRTYTVIGQGLVDAVLSLKAEERRKLFEEAAGIELHRSRREEAVRRLDTTRRNLERVGDILSEIRPRLRSLERQARRAGEYEQIRDDLREVLRIWYGYHWYKLTAILQETKLRVDEAATLHEKLQTDQEETEDDLSRIQIELNSLRMSVQRKSSESSTLLIEKEQVSRRAAVAEARLEWLKDRETSINADLSSLEKQRVELETRLTQVDAGQHFEGEGQPTALEQTDPQLSKTEPGEESPQVSEFLSQRQALQDVLRRREEKQLRLQLLEEKLVDLENQKQAVMSELEDVSVTEADLLSRMDPLLEERESVERKLKAVLEQEENHSQELEDSRSQAKKLNDTIVALQIREASLQTRLESASKLDLVSGNSLLLAAAQEGEVPEPLGPLHGLLQIQPKMRTSVEAILGDRNRGLVFHNMDELELALRWLVEHGLAPAVLFNLSLPDRDEGFEVPQSDAILGIATDFVEGPDSLKPLLRHLFGKAIVVQGLEAAREIVVQLPEDWIVVTENGVIFHPSGSVRTTGHLDEVTDLDPASVEEALIEVRSDLEKALSEAENLKNEIIDLETALSKCELDKTELQESLEKERVEIERFSIERASIETHLSSLQEENQSLTETRTTLLGEKDGLHEEADRLEIDLQVLIRSLSAMGFSLGTASFTHGEEQLLTDIYAGQSNLAQIGNQIELLELQTESAKQRQRETQTEIAGTQAERDGAQEGLEQLMARLDQLEKEREALDKQIQTLDLERLEADRRYHEIRAERRLIDQRYTQDQIDLARKQEELASLELRIRDDFGLVTFDADESTTIQEPLPLNGWVEHLARVDSISPDLENQVNRLRAQIRRMGAINPEAQREYREVRERSTFLTDQIEDLERAEIQLQEVIAELDALMAREFRKTFDAVAEAFHEAFTRLFKGGAAQLMLTESDDLSKTGIDIEVRLPGRREQGLAMLSGGERSLTASALIFALLKVSPTPFCVLDEVDAMLDETNILRFGEILRELSQDTQFLIITHNRQTIQEAEVIYGVSIGTDSASKIISLKLEEAASEYINA